jgi:hypothetical protein
MSIPADEFSVDEGPQAPWRAKPRRAGGPNFYWELEGDARREALEDALGEEGYLAADINHGRRMIDLDVDLTNVWSLPDRIPLDRPGDEAREDVINRFSDAIGQILSAAEWEGIDPAWLCERAQRSNSLAFSEATDLAALREWKTFSRRWET